ncbi:MAG: sensor domain-containing diguanylate cyclase [bacterium]|nr:sensor domain-containing diguanylate cyclase [bacterium]
MNNKEQTRKQFIAQNEALLNATSDLAVILSTDGTILEVNEAAMRRVGRNITELTGKSFFDFFPAEFKALRQMYINIVQQTKEPFRFQDEYDGMMLQVCLYPILGEDKEVDKLAVFVSDNTKFSRMEELLYRYSHILSTVQDPMSYIDRHYIYRTVNDAYLKMYQKSREEIVEHRVDELLGEDFFYQKIKNNIDRCLKGETVQQQEWFEFPDGVKRFMYVSYYPLLSQDKKLVTGVVFNSTDITKIKEMEEKLKLLSVTDPLTQIYNRVKFHDALNHEVKRLRRYQTELSVIMFDIDHFKSINDTYGHDVGDDVLVGLVNLVKKCIRDTDTFSRWGGEEFMLLLPYTDLENAGKLAGRIRFKIEDHTFETVGTVTCSFGVSQFIADDTVETLTKRLDNALYESKRTGRNRVTVG